MKTITTIVIFLFTVVITAQTIQSFTIDSGGAFSENENIKIFYTIGEVNIQEYDVGNFSLSEGFINSNIIGSTLGIEDEDLLDQKIIIYPNPVSEVINIKSQIEVTSIEIFDALGRKLISTKDTKKLKVDFLVSGVYLLRLISENKIFTKKIIVK